VREQSRSINEVARCIGLTERPVPNNSFARVLGIAVVCASATVNARADVGYAPARENRVAIITISGEIGPSDRRDFETFATMAKERSKIDIPYQVRLESKGGDVSTAIEIGRIVRRDGGNTTVQKDAQCLSSCVFILAGGVMRYVGGQVGIHRPFDPTDAATTPEQQKRKYDQIEKDAKRFLKDVNIPPELYDHMFRVPSDSIRYLTADELQRYGLNEDDPYYEGANNAVQAKRLGITTEQFIARLAKAKQDCVRYAENESGTDCFKRIVIDGRP